MSQWIYLDLGEEIGPLSAAQLQQHLQAGKIEEDTLIRHSSSMDWAKAGTINMLSALFQERLAKKKQSTKKADATATSYARPPTKKDYSSLRSFAFIYKIAGWIGTVGGGIAAIVLFAMLASSSGGKDGIVIPWGVVSLLFTAVALMFSSALAAALLDGFADHLENAEQQTELLTQIVNKKP